jgi:putative aldouronate transport system substrate-binding protein
MKKSITMAIIFIMIMSLLAACNDNTNEEAGGNNTTAPATNDSSKDQTSGEEANKPSYWVEGDTDVSVFVYPTAEMLYPEDWPIYQWIKESTNINVKPVIPAGEYADALSLTMASGDIPDVMYLRSYIDANKYGTQGAFINFDDHLDKMPNLKKYWEENPILKQKATASDGNIYSVVTSGLGYTNGRGWMVREDVLADLGMEAPETWDEMYAIATAFKKENPDSYPLVWRRHVKNIGYLLAPTFGTGWDFYQDPKTGEVHYGPHSEEFKALLTELKKWNDEGLIPPDWLSMTTKVWTELMTTNQSIITPDYLGRVDNLNSEFEKAGLEGKMKWISPPQGGPNGKQWVGDFSVSNSGLSVYADAANLEGSLQYVDFLYSDEGSELISWGKEGESFEVVDGKKKYIHADILDDLFEVHTKYGLMSYGTYGKIDSAASLSIISEEEQARYSKNLEHEWPFNSSWPAFTDEERESFIDLWVNLEGFREAQYAAFIMGDRPLSEFDDYVKEAKDGYQFDKIKMVFEQAYARSN